MWYRYSWYIDTCKSDFLSSYGLVYDSYSYKDCPHLSTYWYFSTTVSVSSSSLTSPFSCSNGSTASTATTATTTPRVTGTNAAGCCIPLSLSSTNPGFVNDNYFPYFAAGLWYQNTKITPYSQRTVYTHSSGVFCMWFNDNSYYYFWTIGYCDQVFQTSYGWVKGFGGSSTCADTVTSWQIQPLRSGSFVNDTTMRLTCASGSTTPSFNSSAPCCNNIVLASYNPTFLPSNLPATSLVFGNYSITGLTFNNRPVYQLNNILSNVCMWYSNLGYWIVNFCISAFLTTSTGFIIGNGNGNCPNQVTSWTLTTPPSFQFGTDTTIKATCSSVCLPQSNLVYVEGATFANHSLAQCQDKCKANASCTFYTWFNGTQGCGLRTFPIGGILDIAGQTTGTPTSSVAVPNAVFVSKTLRNTTAELCSRACQADSQCQSWSYFSSNAGASSLVCFINYETPKVSLPIPGPAVVTSGFRTCVLG